MLFTNKSMRREPSVTSVMYASAVVSEKWCMKMLHAERKDKTKQPKPGGLGGAERESSRPAL